VKLLIIVDTKTYVFGEIYQHQLHKALNATHECTYAEIGNLDPKLLEHHYDAVFSCLKIRTLIGRIDEVKRFLGPTRVIVQDYDPWVILADDAPYKGGYHRINDALNVAAFFIPHKFWSDVMRNRHGFNVVTRPIGVMPEYCDATPWEQRTVRTDFRGSPRPYRERAFQKLIEAGAPVKWDRNLIQPYDRFLKHLSTVRIWVQSESEPVYLDGIPYQRNCLWPKAIEVLSRGCFLVRDHQPEAGYYGITSMPSAFLFHDEHEVVGIIDGIESMDATERNDCMRETVAMIKNTDYYRVISDELVGWYNGTIR
jgi:hypothetical protein